MDLLWLNWVSKINQQIEQGAPLPSESPYGFRPGNLIEVMYRGATELAVVVLHPYTAPGGARQVETMFSLTLADINNPLMTPMLQDSMAPTLVSDSFKTFAVDDRFRRYFAVASSCMQGEVDGLVAARAAYLAASLSLPTDEGAMRSIVGQIVEQDVERKQIIEAAAADRMR